MTIIVTGAAGFIGSNIVRALNARGQRDIVAVDNLTRAAKFVNLADCDISDFVDKQDFIGLLRAGAFGHVTAIIHEGACSDTMESDGRYMMENNYRYSVDLLTWCVTQRVPLLYASSAATYGARNLFSEDPAAEAPLNVYGYSKLLFDQVVRRQLATAQSQIIGFRYFNVYGPREQHKGRMASVAFHNFNQFQEHGKVLLFEGWDGWQAGAQQRDFVSVEDVVKVNLHFLDQGGSGIFNLGTGRAQTFNDVATAMANVLRKRAGADPLPTAALVEMGLIEYVPFPEALKGKYQSFTQADLTRLRAAGYSSDFLTVEEGVARYGEWLASQAGL